MLARTPVSAKPWRSTLRGGADPVLLLVCSYLESPQKQPATDEAGVPPHSH